MKNFIYFITGILIISFCACEDEAVISSPPSASFTKTPNVVIADKTNVYFQNTSTGDIDSYFWNFENGQSTSSSKNPSYVFNFDGLQQVKLNVDGPGGSDEKTLSLVVHAFDPACNNLNSSSTHSTAKINSLRGNGLVKNGFIKIKNNYNVTIELLLFSPTDWLNGNYTNRYRYTLNSGAEGVLNINGSAFQYSNEWGVRVQSTNGVISCIRTVGAVGPFNGSQYDILASDILDGI